MPPGSPPRAAAVKLGTVDSLTVETVRLRIDAAYDGTGFVGWSRQPGLRTVQGAIEGAIATVLRDPETEVRLVVAGRTDAGVHATGQVAHLDLSAARWHAVVAARRGDDPFVSLARRLNGVLAADAPDVVITRVALAPLGFDARFSPVWRRYEYRVADELALRDPRRRGHTLWQPGALDVAAMDALAGRLVGLHDFGAFCKPREGATTIRTLLDYSWRRDDDGVLIATVRADAFCHSMVRALVGAAVAVGLGRREPEAIEALLHSPQRTSLFPVVAARGLTLVEVGYPADDELEARAEQTRARREPVSPASAAAVGEGALDPD